jgi:hypothetical protein
MRMQVFDINVGTQTEGVLRRIFGAKRDEVMGGCRKLHKEELRDLYSL